ncbi:MAG: hypothetical protein ACXWDI_07815 [Nocardioides sp.]
MPGLYLNGTDLPAEVYASADVNRVLESLEELLGDDGSLHSYWEEPRGHGWSRSPDPRTSYVQRAIATGACDARRRMGES